jgi:hypothetical protein
MNKYTYAFLVCNCIAGEDGQAKLDLPFQIYHQTICSEGKNHYCYLDNSLIGKEVLVYFAYDVNDEIKVKSFAGYLGDDWKVVQKIQAIQDKWAVKKEDALAVSVQDKVDPTKIVVTKYEGEDKDETVHPYKGE